MIGKILTKTIKIAKINTSPKPWTDDGKYANTITLWAEIEQVVPMGLKGYHGLNNLLMTLLDERFEKFNNKYRSLKYFSMGTDYVNDKIICHFCLCFDHPEPLHKYVLFLKDNGIII